MILVRNMNVNRPIGKVTLSLKRAQPSDNCRLASSGSTPRRADMLPTGRSDATRQANDTRRRRGRYDGVADACVGLSPGVSDPDPPVCACPSVTLATHT